MLNEAHKGDIAAGHRLFTMVHAELKRMAVVKMQGESAKTMLQATSLVNELWIKMMGKGHVAKFDSRGHFFSSAADAMRQILVDAARARMAAKRGGNLKRVELDDLAQIKIPPDEKLLELDEALTRFRQEFPLKAELVMLRYFGGMTIAEASATLSISTATAQRYWAFSRAWLKRTLTLPATETGKRPE